MPRTHKLSPLRHIKTRGTYEADCTCGWALWAPDTQESMAQSNYDLHHARYIAPRG